MVPPPPDNTPPPTPPMPPQQELDVVPISYTNLALPDLTVLIDLVKDIPGLRWEYSDNTCPPTPVSAAPSCVVSAENETFPMTENNLRRAIGPKTEFTSKSETNKPNNQNCPVPTQSSLTPSPDTPIPLARIMPQVSARMTVDQFDDLLTDLSHAILHFLQNYGSGNSTDLDVAVFRAKDSARDQYATVNTLLDEAIHRNFAQAALEREAAEIRKSLTGELEKYKADADRLRLSLHEQFELVSAAVKERDEATKELSDMGNIVKQMKEARGQGEEDQVEKKMLHCEVVRLKAVADHASHLSRDAMKKRDDASWEATLALRSKNTAMDVVAKVGKERDTAIKERDVALQEKGKLLGRLEELERAEKVRLRQEAFQALSMKLGEKKRKVSVEVEFQE